MLSLGNQIAQSSDLTMKPLAEESLNLLVAFLSICIGVVAMLVVAAIERATPRMRDWIRGQRARAGEQGPPHSKRPYPPFDQERDG